MENKDKIIEITLGRSCTQAKWVKIEILPLEELVNKLTLSKVGEKDGPCYTPAIFKNGSRNKNEAEKIDMVALDVDNGTPLEEIKEKLKQKNLYAIVHSTHSHGKEETLVSKDDAKKFEFNATSIFLDRGFHSKIAKQARFKRKGDDYFYEKGKLVIQHPPFPKWRVIFPLKTSWKAADYTSQEIANEAWKKFILSLAKGLSIEADKSCVDSSRLFYFPRHPRGGSPKSTVIQGQFVDIRSFVNKIDDTQSRPRYSKSKSGPASDIPSEMDRSIINKRETYRLINQWCQKYRRLFKFATFIKQKKKHLICGPEREGKIHIKCPNLSNHSDPEPDQATFVADAENYISFTIHCMHNHCQGLEIEDYLLKMIESGQVELEELTDTKFICTYPGMESLIKNHINEPSEENLKKIIYLSIDLKFKNKQVDKILTKLSEGDEIIKTSYMNSYQAIKQTIRINNGIYDPRRSIDYFKKIGKMILIERNQIISKIVLENLKLFGVLYKVVETKEIYYFDDLEKELYSIKESDFQHLCNEVYGLNGTEQFWKYALEEIISFTSRNGKETEVYRFARYKDKILYIQKDNSSAFRLDGDIIDQVDNGTDGVLFLKDTKNEPIVPNYGYEKDTLYEQLVKIPNIVEPQEGRRDLYHCYIYSLFFESILKTKVVLLITGPKKSGKSLAGRALKQAFWGEKANVDVGLANKEDAFWASVCHSYFVCIDNVDTPVDWLADAICVLATGSSFKRRKLYKTNTMVEYSPRCFLAFTSRDPFSFKRDDVADRLFILETATRELLVAELEMLEDIKQKRGEIWGELLTSLNKIVKILKTDEKKYSGSFRIADWAKLVGVIAEVLEIDNIEEKLSGLEKSKSDFVLEGNPIVEGLEFWLDTNPNRGFVSSGALHREIDKLYSNNSREFRIKTPTGFGKMLKNLKPELGGLFEIEQRPGQNNTVEYKIHRKLDDSDSSGVASADF